MPFEELQTDILADSSQLVSEANAGGDALEGVSESADNTGESLFDLDPAAAAAGAGLAGIGAGAQQALDSTRDLRTELDQAAVSAGLSSDEMTSLATDVSDASTPLQETSGMLSVLTERGIESQDELASLSAEFSDLALATGTEAPRATQTAIQTMRAFGDEAEDIGAHTDTLTTVARQTSLDFEEFGEVVGDIQPTIDELGLSMDDAAAYMMALEEEGVNSQRAQELFAQAAESAGGSTEALNEELGVSESTLAAQQEELANAEGATDAYSEAAEGNVSTMDRLRQQWDEMTLVAGDFLQPISAAAPALMGLGAALTAVSTINFAAVIPSITGVVAAMTPLLPIILPIVAAIGLLAAAWKTDFAGIQGVTEDVFGAISDVIGETMDVVWGDIIEPTLATIEAFWADHGRTIETTVEDVFGSVDRTIRTVLSAIQRLIQPILTTIERFWSQFGNNIVSQLTSAFSLVETVVTQALDGVVTTIQTGLALLRGDWDAAWTHVTEFLGRTVDRLGSLVGDVTDLVTEPFDALFEALPAAEDITAPFSSAFEGFMDLFPSVSDVENAVDGIVDPITGIPETVTDTFADIWNATVGGFGLEISGFDISIPSWVPEIGGDSYGWDGFDATIPEMATGGVIEQDGIYRGGEEGPEAVLNAEQTAEVQQGELDLGGGSITPADIRKALAGMVLSLSGSLDVEGDVATIDDVRGELQRQKNIADDRGLRN